MSESTTIHAVLSPDYSKGFAADQRIVAVAVLQTRCLAYTTAQRHRLAANFNQLPVNRAKNCPFFFTPTQRDGAFVIDSLGPTPNYYPSSFMPPRPPKQRDTSSEWKPYAVQEQWDGALVNFESQVTDADFAQARVFWEHELPSVDGRHAQDHFVTNVMRYMTHVREKELRERVYGEYLLVCFLALLLSVRYVS